MNSFPPACFLFLDSVCRSRSRLHLSHPHPFQSESNRFTVDMILSLSLHYLHPNEQAQFPYTSSESVLDRSHTSSRSPTIFIWFLSIFVWSFLHLFPSKKSRPGYEWKNRHHPRFHYPIDISCLRTWRCRLNHPLAVVEISNSLSFSSFSSIFSLFYLALFGVPIRRVFRWSDDMVAIVDVLLNTTFIYD